MTISASELREAVAASLDGLVEVSQGSRGFLVLTPFEAPGGDAVLLEVTTDDDDGSVRVTDTGSAADAIDHAPETDGSKADSERVQSSFGVWHASGTFGASGDAVEIGELCLRVAQASSIFAAMRAGKEQRRKGASLRRRVAQELRKADVAVRQDVKIKGASGHQYQIELFLPEGERVLALVSQSDFAGAQRAHSRLSDIKGVNGYRAVAILDDAGAQTGAARRKVTDGERLLGQVGEVVLASKLDGWISRLSG